MRLSVAVAVSCILITSLSAAEHAAAAIRKQTNIGAQGLGPALKELAKEREFQILYRTELVGERKTAGAVGEFTLEEALNKLLNGTELTFQYLDDNTVTILPLATGAAGVTGAAPTTTSPEVSDLRPQASEKSFWDRLRLAQATEGNTVVGERTPQTSAETPPRRAQIEEVIVTARKRTENIQDVPISISVVGAEEISRRGLMGAADYLRGIPGVNQTDQIVGQTIVIRGVETAPGAQNFVTGATVATYFGETPTTNSAGLAGDTNVDIKLVDIDRVEVLRGPQGTAFGSSSLGGAVRTIPVAPNIDRFEGKITVGYSFTGEEGGDNRSATVVGNMPLIAERLAVRAVGYKFSDSGYYRNVSASDPALQASVITPFNTPNAVVNDDEVGSVDTEGARVAALLQLSDRLQINTSYLLQESEMDGFALANRPDYLQALPLVAPEHSIRGSRQPRADSKIEIANATASYESQAGTLLGTYSYLKSDFTRSFPYVGFNFLFPASQLGASPHDERTAEVRFNSTLQGPVNFVAGVYYENIHEDFTRSDYWYGASGTNLFGIPSAQFISAFHDVRRKEQKAAFGELSWAILPQLTLTGGMRYYDHEREYRRADTAASGTVTTIASTAQVDGTIFRANLSYKPGDDALVYLDWSQGFRVGNSGVGLSPSQCDRNNDGIVDGASIPISATREIGPDSLDSYELGGKLAFFDRRLTTSASIFHIEWEDPVLRVLAPLPPAGCGRSYPANAATATSQGVELQANFQVTSAFHVDAGFSYTRARLTEDAPGVGGVSGDRLPGSPHINANLALQHEFIVAGLDAYVRADSIYVGEYYGGLKPLPNFRAGDYFKLDLAARVMATRHLSVDIYVRNVTNADDFTFRDIADYGPFFGYRLRPRTVGLQFGYQF